MVNWLWFRPPLLDLLVLQLLRPDSLSLPSLNSTFHLEYILVLSRFCLFNVTINDISVVYQTAHSCAGGLKKNFNLWSGSQRHLDIT